MLYIIYQFVNNSNSTLAFFKQACHANPGADTKYQGHIYQDAYF